MQRELTQYLNGTDDEAEISYLRTNPSQNGGDDEMPLTKGPTTRAMARTRGMGLQCTHKAQDELYMGQGRCEDLA